MEREVNFDVSGIVPEAQTIAVAVARIYWKYTQPWFVGLACFGSAVKGGVIPGASDLDFHLYLQEAAFESIDTLRLDVGLAIQADLAQIDPTPFRYIDGGAENGILPEGHVGPIPGNYHLIAGKLPLAEATADELYNQARWALNQLTPLPSFVSDGLLHHGHGRGQLALTVRALCQIVWPVLYQVCCLYQGDALRVWRLPKQDVIALLPIVEPIGQAIRFFHQAVWKYYPLENSVNDALKVIETGVGFLQAVANWASVNGIRSET